MRFSFISTFLLLFLLNITVKAQEHLMDTIPFVLTSSNNIGVETILNDIDTLTLMFHTGASAVFITQGAVQRISSINMDQSASINSWGGKGDVRFSKHNKIQIGSQTWDSIGITEDKHSGPGMDGKFGYNLFENNIVELDFDKSIIVIHEELPQGTFNFERLNFQFQMGSMFIPGAAIIGEQRYDNQFMVHSGYAGSILFDDQFVADNDLGKSLETISEQDLKDSMGNIIKTKKSKLPIFEIAGVTIRDLTVGMFEGSLGRQKFSVMGGNILKRFNIIFDFRNQHIYLKANSNFDEKIGG